MVKAHVQDLASMGRPVTLSSLSASARSRVLATLRPRCPYRIGDLVVGDDPFNGRHGGIVMSLRGKSVELSTAAGVLYYDHRHVTPQE